tara:strand:- start:56 stop:499 length:444 start_codon:yes stop_codon:yes gene_type:complete
MHISLRQPNTATIRFAEVNDIEYALVDGNDPVEVYKKSKMLIDEIRGGSGPKFIEAITYRHYGHVDWRKDVDVGVNRSQEDLDNWLKRDPIDRLQKSLLKENVMSEEDIQSYELEIKDSINKHWESAMNDPYPDDDSLLGRVYYHHD